MRAVASLLLCSGFALNACGSTSAQEPAPRPSSAATRAKDAHAGTSAAATVGIAGCEATVAIDVPRAASAPGVSKQLARLWDVARKRMADDGDGPRLLADLAGLGVSGPSDIRSIELCVPPAPSERGEAQARTGVLIRGDFVADTFLPLVMKWSRSEITQLGHHGGVDVLRLEQGAWFAQRADGALVIALHPSSLHALLAAPSSPRPSGLALAGHIERAFDLGAHRFARAPFPTRGVRSLDFDLGPELDRVRVVLRADDERGADAVAQALRDYIASLTSEVRTARTADDAAGNAIIATAQAASVRSAAGVVTLEGALPAMLAPLVLRTFDDLGS
jgi:hypothetical protein